MCCKFSQLGYIGIYASRYGRETVDRQEENGEVWLSNDEGVEVLLNKPYNTFIKI
jgi:hypothetical protein